MRRIVTLIAYILLVVGYGSAFASDVRPAGGGGGGGAVSSVTGADGLVCSPTTGNVSCEIAACSATEILEYDGADWQCITTPGSSPGGADTQVQFNDGGSAFGGDAGLVFNKTTNNLTVSGDIQTNDRFVAVSTVTNTVAHLEHEANDANATALALIKDKVAGAPHADTEGIGLIRFYGDNASGTESETVRIRVDASQLWSDTANGARLTFTLTPDDSIFSASEDRFIIDGDGTSEWTTNGTLGLHMDAGGNILSDGNITIQQTTTVPYLAVHSVDGVAGPYLSLTAEEVGGPVDDTDQLGKILFRGEDGEGGVSTSGLIEVRASEDWVDATPGPAEYGAGMTLSVVPTGGTVIQTRFALSGDGTSEWTADGTDGVEMTAAGVMQAHGAGSLLADAYVAGSVDATAIGPSAVDTSEIATGAVRSAEIQDGEVKEGDIDSAAVTVTKIGPDAVTGAKIADDAIDADHLATGSVTADAIGVNSVTLTTDTVGNYVASMSAFSSKITVSGGSGEGATPTVDLGTVALSDLSSFTTSVFETAVTGETGSGAVVFGTSPIIVTPTIASLTNAQHDHLDAAGGGVLTAGAVSSVTPHPLFGSGADGAMDFSNPSDCDVDQPDGCPASLGCDTCAGTAPACTCTINVAGAGLNSNVGTGNVAGSFDRSYTSFLLHASAIIVFNNDTITTKGDNVRSQRGEFVIRSTGDITINGTINTIGSGEAGYASSGATQNGAGVGSIGTACAGKAAGGTAGNNGTDGIDCTVFAWQVGQDIPPLAGDTGGKGGCTGVAGSINGVNARAGKGGGGGGGGGAGCSGSGGTCADGGNGGGGLALIARDTLTVTGTLDTSGDDSTSLNPGGAGGGGSILMIYDTLAETTPTYTDDGGTGATGITNCGDAGDGGDGNVVQVDHGLNG